MSVRRTPAVLAAGVAAVLAVAGGMATVAYAQSGCSVRYSVTSQWPGGFTGNVNLTNLGAPVTGWSLTWSFTAGKRVDHGWHAVFPAAGPQVEARNAGWNGNLGTGGGVSFGFNGLWNNQSNPVPTNFALNGSPCTGGTTSPSASPSTSPSTSPSPSQGLPSSFQWSSGPALIAPKPDAQHPIVSVKDPTVVFHNGRWHVYATTANTSGQWSLVYTSFTDFSQAASAPHYYLDTGSAIGPGYRAAPQLVYFAPQNLWYLIYQTGLPTFTTTTDPGNPGSWSTPRNFMNSEPAIVTQNKGANGYWIDYWLICDTVNCYLFSHDGQGHIYRSQTTVANFPNGFGNTIIFMQDTQNRFNLWEASNVYRVQGTNQYLMLVEAIGANGRRYFRSWTSTNLGGLNWTPLANTESNPFAGNANLSFDSGVSPWTQDVSHGEMLRAGNDQTLPISPCDMRYLYQGLDPAAGGEYSQLPWRLALLRQTNSTC